MSADIKIKLQAELDELESELRVHLPKEIKRALVFNPKTPVGVSLRFLSFMKESDLKGLARSRGIPQPVKTAAQQRIESMEKSRRGPQKK